MEVKEERLASSRRLEGSAGEEAESGKSTRSALGILATQLALYPISFVVSVLVARILGPEDRGIYAFLLLPGGMILPLLSFGFGLGVLYYTASGRYDVKDVSFSSLLFGFGKGAFCACVVAGLWYIGALGEIGENIQLALLVPVLIALPIEGVFMEALKLVKGSSWFSAMNVMTALGKILPVLSLLSLVVVAKLGIYGAAISILVTSTCKTSVLVYMIWAKFLPRISVDTRFIAKSVRYGIKSWPGVLTREVNLRLDHMLLGLFAAPGALGNYSVATALSELLWLFPHAIFPVLFNRVAKGREQAEQSRELNRIHRLLVGIAAFSAIGLVFVGVWIVPLIYGEAFADAGIALIVLLPGTIAMVTPKVIGAYFPATGKPGLTSVINIIGAAVSVLLYLTLVPSMGLIGAALASSVTYIIWSLTTYLFYQKFVETTLIEVYLVKWRDVIWGKERIVQSMGSWKSKFRRRLW